jgi:hypothetical protein
LLAIPQGFAMALGNRLVTFRGKANVTSLDLPGQALRLTGTPPHTKPAVVVSMDHGAIIHWLDSKEWQELDRDIASPQATFIPGGPLVLLAGLHLILLEGDSRGMYQVTRMQLSGQPPAAVSPTDQPSQFALLDRNGQVTVYHCSR